MPVKVVIRLNAPKRSVPPVTALPKLSLQQALDFSKNVSPRHAGKPGDAIMSLNVARSPKSVNPATAPEVLCAVIALVDLEHRGRLRSSGDSLD